MRRNSPNRHACRSGRRDGWLGVMQCIAPQNHPSCQQIGSINHQRVSLSRGVTSALPCPDFFPFCGQPHFLRLEPPSPSHTSPFCPWGKNKGLNNLGTQHIRLQYDPACMHQKAKRPVGNGTEPVIHHSPENNCQLRVSVFSVHARTLAAPKNDAGNLYFPPLSKSL